MTLLTPACFRVSWMPCAVVSAARLDGLVLRRTEFQQYREPVRVRLGYLPAPSVPPNRNVIVRAHQPTGYPRLRAARGAIPNKAQLGALSESSTQNPPLSGTAKLRPRIAAGLVLMPTSGNQRRLAWARRKATIPSCIPVGREVGRFSNDFKG